MFVANRFPALKRWAIVERPYGTQFISNLHSKLKRGLLSSVPTGTECPPLSLYVLRSRVGLSGVIDFNSEVLLTNAEVLRLLLAERSEFAQDDSQW